MNMKTSRPGRAIRPWVSAVLAGAFLTLTASHCNDVTGPGHPAGVPTAVPPTPTPVPAPPTLASVTVQGPAQRDSKIDFTGTGFDATSRFGIGRGGYALVLYLINPRAVQIGVVEVEIPQTGGAGGYYDEACVSTRAGTACRPVLFYLSQ